MKKSIGVDVKAPETKCNDEKCAWHGKLPVRGKIIKGHVTSAKAKDTAVVMWRHDRFVTKYESFERRKSSVIAHNPPCIKAREGDEVVIAECRPISKTKSFVIVSKAGGKK